MLLSQTLTIFNIEFKVELSQNNGKRNEVIGFYQHFLNMITQQLVIQAKDYDITIFDVNTCYTDREYFYTDISRGRSVDQLTVFNHSNKVENHLYDSRVTQYFNLKIPNYMQQYKKCFRGYNINGYVTTEWIYKQLNKQNL